MRLAVYRRETRAEADVTLVLARGWSASAAVRDERDPPRPGRRRGAAPHLPIRAATKPRLKVVSQRDSADVATVYEHATRAIGTLVRETVQQEIRTSRRNAARMVYLAHDSNATAAASAPGLLAPDTERRPRPPTRPPRDADGILRAATQLLLIMRGARGFGGRLPRIET